MPKDSPPGLSAVLISYVPFLAGDPFEEIPRDRFEELATLVDTMPSGQAQACLWFKRDVKSDDDYKLSPVFLYKNADDMVGHLVAWSENKPLEWFSLHLRHKRGKYVFALMPKFEKSVERYKIAYQLRTGFPIPKDTRFSIIFRTLFFVSGDQNVFNLERQRIGETTEIGFLDSNKVDFKNLEESLTKLDDSEINWLGPFSLAPNKDVLKYLDGILEDAKEPRQGSFRV